MNFSLEVMVEFTLIKHSVSLQAASAVAEQSNLWMTLASEGVAGEADICLCLTLLSQFLLISNICFRLFTVFVTVSSKAWHQPLQSSEFEFQSS